MPSTKFPLPTPAAGVGLTPASRASWSGQLKTGDISIPVKAYALTVTSSSGPLCQIHAGCGRKLEYHKCCPVHGQIPHDQIGKAYPYAEHDFVELTEQELAPLAPHPEHVAVIQQFFDPAQLNLTILSGRSFQLVPAHEAALRPYGAFATALRQADVWGFGTLGLSGRVQLLVVRVVEHLLQVFLLHWPAQRRAAPEVRPPLASETRPLAGQYLQAIRERVGSISWDEFRDDWDSRLVGLVQTKVEQRSAVVTLPLRPGAHPSRARSTRPRKPARAA